MKRTNWKDLKNKRKFLSLDKNENFDFTLREKLHKFFITLSPEDICLYPDVAKGYECLSNYTDINSDNLILSHGSEQSLKLIFETLHRIYKCRSITICHPTFESDMNNKTLNRNSRPYGYPRQSNRRLLKYIKDGFTIDQENLLLWLENQEASFEYRRRLKNK